MKTKGCIPEGTPCPNCQSHDRVIREIQLNLKQWRCVGCNRFLDLISIPGKATVKKPKGEDTGAK